jgi:hypothetical protein
LSTTSVTGFSRFAEMCSPGEFRGHHRRRRQVQSVLGRAPAEKLERSGARRVLVLDACHNNPFHFKRNEAGGLAAMSVNAEGTLVASRRATTTRPTTTAAATTACIPNTFWRSCTPQV